MELVLILVIVMVIFGAKRLPGLGEALGKGIKNFKEGLSGKTADDPEKRRSDETR
jgi:sec-independent protein translocase protein TatA